MVGSVKKKIGVRVKGMGRRSRKAVKKPQKEQTKKQDRIGDWVDCIHVKKEKKMWASNCDGQGGGLGITKNSV